MAGSGTQGRGRRAARVAGALLALGLGAVACSSGPPQQGVAAPGSAADPAATVAKVGSGTGQSDTPIASADGVAPNGADVGIPVRVEVLSLDRATADTVRLRFRVANTGKGTIKPSNTLGATGTSYDVSGVSLIDLANNLRYLVMVDDKGGCVCTEVATLAEIQPGGTYTFEASLPAPPAAVSVVEVQVNSWAIVHDVTIGGGNG